MPSEKLNPLELPVPEALAGPSPKAGLGLRTNNPFANFAPARASLPKTIGEISSGLALPLKSALPGQPALDCRPEVVRPARPISAVTVRYV